MNNDLNNQGNQTNNSNGVTYYTKKEGSIEGVHIDSNGRKSYFYLNTNRYVWVIVIVLLAIVGFAFIFSSVFFQNVFQQMNDLVETKRIEEEQNALGEELVLGENDLKKRNEIIDGLNNIFSVSDFSSYTDYIKDDNFKFIFFVYLTKDYSDNTKSLVSGENNINGAYSMNLTNINSYYFKFFGENFDYTKLNKDSAFFEKEVQFDRYYYPSLVDNIIYTKYNVESNSTMKFKYVKTTYNDKSELYSDVLEYNNTSKNENFYVALRYKVDPKGFISYKSFKIIE